MEETPSNTSESIKPETEIKSKTRNNKVNDLSGLKSQNQTLMALPQKEKKPPMCNSAPKQEKQDQLEIK